MEVSSYLIGALAFSIQLLGWLLIPNALLIARTPQAALGWALVLFFLPVIGIPLFLVFGESKFSGYTLAGAGENPELDAVLRQAQEALAPVRDCFSDKYEAVGCVVDRLCGLPVTGGNRVRLLVNGQETFEAIFQAIDRAAREVAVQFFIIRDDAVGRELLSRLGTAARRGVAVKVLYDGVGSKHLPEDFLQRLAADGVVAASFVTNRQLGRRFQLNFRNHRKLVVADGVTAFLGGINFGNEYCGPSPRFAFWRDTHLEISGPALAGLRVNFAEDWFYATGEVLALDWGGEAAVEGKRVALVASGPAEKVEICPAVFLEAIYAAKERLWLASPYFVPDPGLRQAILHAAIRGVDVRLLLPRHPDHVLPWLTSFSHYPVLRDAGVRVFRYEKGFMHQKVMLVDNDLASVGSVNLDYRSFLLNFELSALVEDCDFAATVEKMLEQDFADAREEDLNFYDKSGLGFRLKVRLAALASPEQ